MNIKINRDSEDLNNQTKNLRKHGSKFTPLDLTFGVIPDQNYKSNYKMVELDTLRSNVEFDAKSDADRSTI